MKVLISKTPVKSHVGYVVIDNFDSFVELIEKRIHDITDIKFNDYLLGMSCLFWTADHDLRLLGSVRMTVTIPDREQSSDMWQCIRKYMNKLFYLRGQKGYKHRWITGRITR